MEAKLSLHRVLSELKMLDRRITDAIGDVNPQAVMVGNKLKNISLSVEEFETQAKSSLQKVRDLIDRRYKLKCALIKANAETKVTISGKEMTIADAIDYKTVIEYKEQLLRHLRNKFTNVTNMYNSEVEKMETKLDETVKAATNKSDKPDKDLIAALTESYRKANDVKVIDPTHLSEIITTLSKEVDDFKAEVDAVLAEANATTFVEV